MSNTQTLPAQTEDSNLVFPWSFIPIPVQDSMGVTNVAYYVGDKDIASAISDKVFHCEADALADYEVLASELLHGKRLPLHMPSVEAAERIEALEDSLVKFGKELHASRGKPIDTTYTDAEVLEPVMIGLSNAGFNLIRFKGNYYFRIFVDGKIHTVFESIYESKFDAECKAVDMATCLNQ